MTLHAAENIGDAFDATREFLLPFSLGRWAKLALVAFFIGTGTGVPSSDFDASATSEDVPDADVPSTVPDDLFLVGVTVAAAVVVLAILWALISSIMEFVFVESLRNEDVTIRRYWGRRWRQGLRLFGFRLVLGLGVLALVGGWLALVLLPAFTGGDLTGPVVLFLLGIPLVLAVLLLVSVVYLFTTVFVVPIMIKTDSDVLAAWRRLWSSIRAEWKEYLVYAVLSAVLTFAAGLAAGIVLGVVAVVLLIPLGGVGLVVFLSGSLAAPAGLAVLAVLVVVFLAGMSVAWAFVQVPVVTYLRYYALLVLGDIEESFDLIPGQRAAIRREDEPR